MPEVIGGKPIISFFESNVSASVNQLMDTIALDVSKTFEWTYSLEDTTNSKYRSGKIYATHKDSANPDYSISNIQGDSLSHAISVLLDGTNIKLYIQNNEAVTLKIKASRISI